MRQNKLLALVLAFALIVTLIPSFAMAEEAAAITITGNVTASYYGNMAFADTHLKPAGVTVTLGSGIEEGRILWSTNNANVARFYSGGEEDWEPTETYTTWFSKENPAEDLRPNLYLVGPNNALKSAKATITGKVYQNVYEGEGENRTYVGEIYKGSASFTVTLNVVPATTITLAKTAKSTTKGSWVWLNDEFQPVLKTADENKLPTYSDPEKDVIWQVSDTSVARVFWYENEYDDRKGWVLEALAAGKDVEVTVTDRCKNASASFKLTVIEGEEQGDDPAADAPCYEEVTFTAKTEFVLDQEGVEQEFDLYRYMVVSPAYVESDWLVWDSDNPQVVSVSQNGYEQNVIGENGHGLDPVLTLHKKGEATITVCSKVSGKQIGSIKITVKDRDDETESYESLQFKTTTLTKKVATVRAYTPDLDDYLEKTPTGYVADTVLYTALDRDIASVDGDGNVTFRQFGTARFEAYSKNNPEVKTPTPISITIVEYTDIPFKTIAFKKSAPTKLYLNDNTFDLSTYVETTESDATDTLVWATSDPAVATIANGTLTLIKKGNVTVTASSKLDPKKVEPAKLDIQILELSDIPYTALSFSPDTYTVYMTEGNNTLELNAGEHPFLVVKPAEAIGAGDTLIWESKNPDIAIVDQTGKVTMKREGTAVITVSSYLNKDCAAGTFTLNVMEAKPVYAESVTVAPSALTLYMEDYFRVDDNGNLSCNVQLENCLVVKTEPALAATNDTFVYTISDPTVAWIKDGKLGLIQKGKFTLTVTSFNNKDCKPGKCEITVEDKRYEPFEDIIVNPEKDTVVLEPTYYVEDDYVGYQTIALANYIQGVKGHNDMLSLTVDKPELATLSSRWEGETVIWSLQPKDEGKVVITARSYIDPKNDKLKKTLTLTFKKLEVPFQSVEFLDAAYTVGLSAGTFRASEYVVVEPLVSNDDLIWTSSDPQTASVDQLGLVTLKKVTEKDKPVKITARSYLNPEKRASFTLTITDLSRPITKLEALEPSLTLKTYDNTNINLADFIVIDPVDYTVEDGLVFTSNHPEFVTVDRTTGVINLLNATPGEATITVRTKLGKADPVKITVTHAPDELKSIKFVDVPNLTPANAWSVDDDGNPVLTPLKLYEYLETEPAYYANEWANYYSRFTWNSSDPQAMLINVYGEACFLKPAEKVTVTVTMEGTKKKAEADIALTANNVTGIKFSKNPIELKVDDSFALVTNVKALEPENCDFYDYAWSSSDPSIARVNEGFVTGISVGEATITMTVKNYDETEVTRTFKVKVTQNTIEKIKFAQKKQTLKIGTNVEDRDNQLKLYFSVKPAGANFDPNDDLIIESTNPNVLKLVKKDGKLVGKSHSYGMYFVTVQGKAPGAAKIKIKLADDTKVSASTKVTVEGINVSKVKMPKKTMRLYYYRVDDDHPLQQNMYRIKVNIEPANAWYATEWETTDAGVAFIQRTESNSSDSIGEISDEGANTAYIVTTGAGTAVISVKVSDGKTVKTAKMTVIVTTKMSRIKLSPKNATITMIKGEDNTLQLVATNAETGDPVDVKWSSSKSKVATVDSTGLVKALKPGTTVITATTKDGNKVTASCNIKVEKKPVQSISGKKKLTMEVGETKTLKIKVKPTDAYNPAVKFSSSKSKIVSVDSEGNITALKAGKCVITVKAKDGSKVKLKIEVTVK